MIKVGQFRLTESGVDNVTRKRGFGVDDVTRGCGFGAVRAWACGRGVQRCCLCLVSGIESETKRRCWLEPRARPEVPWWISHALREPKYNVSM
jgi:hypothetical protein